MTKLNLKSSKKPVSKRDDVKVTISLPPTITVGLKMSDLCLDYDHMERDLETGELKAAPTASDVVKDIEANATNVCDALEMLDIYLFDLIDFDQVELSIEENKEGKAK